MTFADRLKELRAEKKMSLNDIAAYLDIQRATVYKYEHGIITNIPPDKVHKLANLFGVTRPYMMGWTDERNADPHKNLDTVAEKLRHTSEGEFVTENDTTYWRATGQRIADCTTAATQATRALIKFGISRTPIYPQHILQHSQYASVITFGSDSEYDEIVLNTKTFFSSRANDFFMTLPYINKNGEDQYLFAMKRNAQIGKLKLSLAVELGHIYLGHTAMMRNGSRKQQEAECFATHLVFPRPVIQLLMDRGFVFTKRTFSRIFGDCEWCLDSILTAAPVTVSAELNRLLKEQFVPYIDTLEETGLLKIPTYNAPVLDLSRYMEGYEE